MILVAKPEEGARDHLPTTTMRKKKARCFAINNFTILFSLLVFVAIFAFVAPLPSLSTPRSRHRKKLHVRNFEIADDMFWKDGEPFRVIGGDLHYFRVLPEYWEDRLLRAKALGLNTIQTYVPWNLHEQRPGDLFFDGIANIVSFLRLCQKLDLLVMLRAGPYICAEWDLGGFPAWLLAKQPALKLRSSDPEYLKMVDEWWGILLPKVSPFLYGNGGPIIMVQIENEYGSYADDKAYLHHLVNLARKHLGDDVILYTTDGGTRTTLEKGTISGGSVYSAVDFATGDQPWPIFKLQKQFNAPGKSPPLSSEFYTGWLTHWGERIAKTDADFTANELGKILSRNGSVVLYMAHGGTNFGFFNGANTGSDESDYKPDLTSYDYDAPIRETGDVDNAKFRAIRRVIQQYATVTLPPVPSNNEKAGYGYVQLKKTSNLFDIIGIPNDTNVVESASPIPMEFVGQMHGFLLYISEFNTHDNASSLMISKDAQTGKIIGRGIERGGLYFLEEEIQQGEAILVRGSDAEKLWTWHRRLGHPSFGYLEKLFPALVKNKPIFRCETCILAKSHKHSYHSSFNKAVIPFMLIHSDVWGPAPVTGIFGYLYYVVFIDDCTRMSWIYFLKHKSEVYDVFVDFYNMVGTQFQTRPRILRSDNGREYVNSNMHKFFTTKGLIHQTSCPDTPQQNGVAERKNRTLLEMTRALMIDSSVPTYLWPEAIATANYLTNRLPTKVLTYKTPLDTFQTFYPLPFSHSLPPRIFGCTVYIHRHKRVRTKFESRAGKCVFVGYGRNQKGYRCYDPATRQIHTTMDCDFIEDQFHYRHPRCQGEKIDDDLRWLISPIHTKPVSDPKDQVGNATEAPSPQGVQPQTSSPSPIPSEHQVSSLDNSLNIMDSTFVDEVEVSGVEEVSQEYQENEEQLPYVLPPRSTRGVPPRRYDPDFEAKRSRYPVRETGEGNLSHSALAFNTTLYSTKLPETVEEALATDHWRKAMEEEINALKKNGTWEKCDLQKTKRVVGCKWVFTVKYTADGTIERYKARLVAKGYTQTYGVDYSETFSPVAKLDTIRVLFSIAANLDWPLHQFDVKNAFLHGELKEEVYMEAPPGFTSEFSDKEGCRLKKALYGLKQSPRAWFGRFTSAMKRFGYRQSHSDHTLFLRKRVGKITCLIIYVDDMVITGDDEVEIENLKKKLFQEFEMKDLGRLKYFLGIEVLRSNKGIFISQKKYVLDLLAETGMVDCKPIETPIMVNHGLQILEGVEFADRMQYQRLVGKLIYLAHTRPDIAYAVGVVSRFMHKPQAHHMEAVFRILRYLKGTPGKGVLYQKNGHINLTAYTDADWAGDRDDRKSTSGYFTLVGGNLVTWRSKKQKVVALSSAEAEFRGVAKGIQEVLWLRKLLIDLGFPQKGSCNVYCDNRAAISISENPVQHDRTKHVEVDRHFIKEKLENDIIKLPHVKSEDQLADILTKAVGAQWFNSVLDKLSIGDPITQLEGEC